MLDWQDLKAEKNGRSLVRLTRALPPVFPRVVLARALARPFVPPTPRLAIESYWRAHPIRADRLAQALAARSQAPARLDLAARGPQGRPAFHVPHATASAERSQDFAACAVNRFIDSAGTLTLGRRSQQECGVAQQFWNSPSTQIRLWRRLQSRRCAETGGRLWRNASKTPTELYVW